MELNINNEITNKKQANKEVTCFIKELNSVLENKNELKVYSNLYNEILKDQKYEYYLYVDVVSYYHKTNFSYSINDDAYYSNSIYFDNKHLFFYSGFDFFTTCISTGRRQLQETKAVYYRCKSRN